MVFQLFGFSPAQEIIDQGLAITTSFMKHEDPKSGYGGDWAVRVAVAEKKRHKEGYSVHVEALIYSEVLSVLYFSNFRGSRTIYKYTFKRR